MVPKKGVAGTDNLWHVDPIHSKAEFTAVHLGITHVPGTIPIKNATIRTLSGQTVPASINAELDASWIDTKYADRDNDLKSAHFFDVAKFPTISFSNKSIKATSKVDFEVTGDLVMHGVTKSIQLIGHCDGEGKDLNGKPIIAYDAHATIDRRDWNMTYGYPIVGNDITLALTVEAGRLRETISAAARQVDATAPGHGIDFMCHVLYGATRRRSPEC